jgi:hypothetical protein
MLYQYSYHQKKLGGCWDPRLTSSSRGVAFYDDKVVVCRKVAEYKIAADQVVLPS